MHPTIIDLGTEDDAGFWADALRFAPFPHTDYPVPFSIQARATDRRGEDAPCFSPSAVLSPFHDERNATEAQAKHD